MEYNISFKLPEGSDPKYKKVGKQKQKQYGPYISICLEDIKEVIEIIEKHKMARFFDKTGKHYFSLSMRNFDDNKQLPPAQEKHTQEKANAYVAEELNDEIPF